MKVFQRLVRKLLYLLLCTMVISCSDKSEPIVPEPNPEPEPTPVEKEYELADSVIELEGDLLENVSSVKGDTLVYESGTPANELPKVGDIVLVTQSTDVFPYGFLGKVTKISNDGNINVITEAAALDEAFVYLDVEGTYELEPVDSQERSRTSIENTESYNISHKISVEISRYISGTVELGINAKLGFKFYIDKRNGKNIRSGYVDVDLENYIGLGASLAYGEKDEDDGKDEAKQLGNGLKLGKIVVGAILIEPVLQPYIKPKLEGFAKFTWSGETRNVRRIRMNFDGDKWSMAPMETDKAEFDFDASPDIDMNGSAFLGPGLALEFRLYGNKNLKVALNAQAGIEASGEMSLATNKEKVYETLQDTKLSLALKGGVGLEASAKVFFIKLKWEHMFEKVWYQWDWYAFPSFENNSLAYEQGDMFASTTLGRNLLWKQDVGLALYNGDECIKVSEPVEYKFEKDFKERNPLEGMFEDIPEEKKDNYSVWSYVKWGDLYIKCVNLSKADVKAVDLGLNVKWASFNLGASSPEDYGVYFAFGEVNAKSEYTSENWNNPWILQLSGDNDAATHQLGSTWRMPTKEDCEELLRECTWELEDRGNIKGYKITGKTGNSIFLPLTGSYGSKEGKNYEARYRTSEAELDGAGYSDPSTIVMELQKDFSDTEMDHAAGWSGHPIRPVEIDFVGKWIREDCQCNPLCHYKFEADSTGYYNETYNDGHVKKTTFRWSFDGQFLKLTRNHVDNSDDDGIDISKIVFQNGSRFARYGSDYDFEPIEVNTTYFYRSKE